MISHEYVDNFIKLWRENKIILNKERILLIEYLEKYILSRDDIYFHEKHIENFVKFTEKNYFKLQDFQKFIIPFIFLYFKEDDELFYEQFLIMMARGGGKNGLITAIVHYLISPFHGIKNYDCEVVANSELQAQTSFKEMYECIKEKEMEDFFDLTKQSITSKHTNSTFRFATSNASTKDGKRSGAIVYDEIHYFTNADIVNVFSSGLGKVKNPREFFITTDGFIVDGYLSKMKERAMKILTGEEVEDRLFPFICKIDDVSEVDKPEMYEKAQPMFHEPRSDYGKRLYKKVLSQYKQLATNPSARPEFVTKRMNLPEVDLAKVVAPWDEVLATNRPLPNLENRACIGGLDYGSIRDFAAVGLLFKIDGEYVWKTHSFARKEYLDYAKLKPPIYEWAKQGLLTIVDEPSIDPMHIVNWFLEQREKYGLKKVIADNFRMDLLRPLFEQHGLEYEIIKNPRAIHSLLAPRIEDAFANKKIVWGSNQLMNWYTGNVLVSIKKDGNKEYIKQDEHRRKTDGFQAFVHAMYRADEIEDVDYSQVFKRMASLNF